MDHPADLRLVFWETTSACNLRCQHCRRTETEASDEELSTAEGLSLIDQIAGVGRPVLVFSGGEPLMRRDLWTLLDHARDRGLITAVATNGTRVTAEVAGRLREAGVHRVSISLDGSEAATHDAFRGQPGSFEAALAGQAHLHRAGVPTQINVSVARHNRDQLPDLYQRAKDIGAVALHLFLVVPVGCGVEMEDDVRLSPAETETVLEWLAERHGDPALAVKATCAPQYERILRQRHGPGVLRRGGLDATTRGCLAGSAVCFVSAKGQVFPCGYLPTPAGDLRHERFATIWRSAPLFRALRNPDRLSGSCGFCDYRRVCGGCRARAYALHGDPLAEEPSCSYGRGGMD